MSNNITKCFSIWRITPFIRQSTAYKWHKLDVKKRTTFAPMLIDIKLLQRARTSLWTVTVNTSETKSCRTYLSKSVSSLFSTTRRDRCILPPSPCKRYKRSILLLTNRIHKTLITFLPIREITSSSKGIFDPELFTSWPFWTQCTSLWDRIRTPRRPTVARILRIFAWNTPSIFLSF